MSDDPKSNPHSTTELRILITEDKDGRLTVQHAAYIKGTEIVIPMRPSHILGHLRAASAVLEREFYTLSEERDKSNSTVREREKGRKGK
jgi:hypothetical protein